jgi:hypothetical protein
MVGSRAHTKKICRPARVTGSPQTPGDQSAAGATGILPSNPTEPWEAENGPLWPRVGSMRGVEL